MRKSKKIRTQIKSVCDYNCQRNYQLHGLHISPPTIDSKHEEAVQMQDTVGTMTCLYLTISLVFSCPKLRTQSKGGRKRNATDVAHKKYIKSTN